MNEKRFDMVQVLMFALLFYYGVRLILAVV